MRTIRLFSAILNLPENLKELQMKLIIRWAVSSLALFAAEYFIPGIHVEDPEAWPIFVIMALILGLVNAIIRPFLKLLSCPLILLTLH